MKSNIKRTLAVILAVVFVALTFAACGSGGSNKKGNNGDTPEATEISVCLASEPATLDPALNSAVDGATLVSHLFSGLAKWEQDDSGKTVIVPDVALELSEGVKGDDGKITYTYKLDSNAKWSDGSQVTAGDFVFSWNRAVSVDLAADYGYMFELVDGYDKVTEVDDEGNAVNPDAKLNVSAPDDTTLVVTATAEVPYWNELLAFPTFFPVKESAVANENWAADPSTYVCNGMYTIKSWEHNSVITLEKNANHPNAENVTMDTIKFYLSDDANNMLSNFKNGDWQLIDDVPTNEISTLKEEYGEEFKVEGQLGTYYVCWNDNKSLLPEGNTLAGAEKERAEEEVRKAIALLIDRNYIIDEIAQGGQSPASSFVSMGLTNPDGSEFYLDAGDKAANGYSGYYDVSVDATQSNFDKAVEILKKYYNYDDASKKFTNFPTITYLYNTNEGHKAIAEYIQATLGNIGITMKLENQEWATLLETRKSGNYTVTRNGWLCDYNDPISMIDLFTTSSGNNDCQLGKGSSADLKAYSIDLTPFGYDIKVENGTWAETFDVLIATIKSCEDLEVRNKMMHYAEDMIMNTGCVTPIYYYTDLYMIDSSVEGFFTSPLGYKYFMYCTISD